MSRDELTGSLCRGESGTNTGRSGDIILLCAANRPITWCLTSSLARSQASAASTLPSNSAQVRRRDEQDDTQWSKPAGRANHTRHEGTDFIGQEPGTIELYIGGKAVFEYLIV